MSMPVPVTIDGARFELQRDAAVYLDISVSRLSQLLKAAIPEPAKYMGHVIAYTNRVKRPQHVTETPLYIDGVKYPSYAAAATFLGISSKQLYTLLGNGGRAYHGHDLREEAIYEAELEAAREQEANETSVAHIHQAGEPLLVEPVTHRLGVYQGQRV
jgi:hypothetical protein